MKSLSDRRTFLKSLSVTGLGLGLSGNRFVSGKTALDAGLKPEQGFDAAPGSKVADRAREPVRIGIIGLDTSHSIAFTDLINNPEAGDDWSDFRVTHAYPYGSRTIESSYSRIPGYIEDMRQRQVRIAGSIGELLEETDCILLETNDGHPRLEQALQVMHAGKPMFVDKPVAASLKDTIAILEASKRFGVPVFSTSALRYIDQAQEVRYHQRVGEVMGADVYSNAAIEPTHPDLYWFGIHGVEILFTVMGMGCTGVRRTKTDFSDIVAGSWDDGRLGMFRGIRSGRRGYGGIVFGSSEILTLGPYRGYRPLITEITRFFRTGTTPVSLDETLEIYAFMEAADESVRRGGMEVGLDEVLAAARS